jgi:hypothetical protein
MLTKNDLKLFEILDEFVDKTLGFGCYIEKWKQDYYLWQEDKNTYTIYKKEWFKLFVLENNHNNNQYIKWEFCKIIWRYPTLSTVLRYIFTKLYRYMSITQSSITQSSITTIDEQWNEISFDLTKELKDRTEEQKEELILFLKSL